MSAAQITARTSLACQVDLAPSALFDTPTVATLALLVTEQMAAQAPEDELTLLVAELEMLSDDEAQARLERPR